MDTSDYMMIGGVAVLAVFAAPIALGFGTVGVTAGSTAAAMQSAIGCVQAGSVFAQTTSLAMQGAFVKGAAAGAGTAVAGYFYSYFE